MASSLNVLNPGHFDDAADECVNANVNVNEDKLYDNEEEYDCDDGNDEYYASLEADLYGDELQQFSSTNTFNAKSITLSANSMSHSVKNRVSAMQDMESSSSRHAVKNTGRDDRATVEQCLDPRTRLILFKLLSNGYLSKIDGCLSTGKEANVYFGLSGKRATQSDAGQDDDTITEYAIKIYKTSILVFKDRDKYVSGEHRWRKGYCKSNPRKMVQVWAEKELRNYKRLYNAGIRCPKPLLLKSNVLIMEFLGEQGWPSPRLRDASLSEKRMREAYVQTVVLMRRMFQRCKLVHGDLSEYNLLWHRNEVYMIDVSQSVESDHPSALDFLRKDVANVNDFFRKGASLNVMSTRQLFDFTISITIEDTPEAESQALDKIMVAVEENAESLNCASEQIRREIKQQEEVDDAVFMSQFLPRSLNQVADYNITQIQKGRAEEGYASAVAALTGNKEVIEAVAERYGTNEARLVEGNNNDENSSVYSYEIEDNESVGDEGGFVKTPMTPEELHARKNAVRLSRKENKKKVREERSEKRKIKIKKKDKKRAINKAKTKKK